MQNYVQTIIVTLLLIIMCRNHSDISTTAWGSPWQFRQNLPQGTCQQSTTNDRQCVQDIEGKPNKQGTHCKQSTHVSDRKLARNCLDFNFA